MPEKSEKFEKAMIENQEVFSFVERVKERLRFYGLSNLSNIEAVGLRKIAAAVLSELKTNPASNGSLSAVDPVFETINRFLAEFYDCRIDDFFLGDLHDGEVTFGKELKKRESGMIAYLKSKQEKRHKP